MLSSCAGGHFSKVEGWHVSPVNFGAVNVCSGVPRQTRLLH